MRRTVSYSSDSSGTWTPDSESKNKNVQKIYLIPAKLTPCQISEYHDLIESSTCFTSCSIPRNADVIVTAVSMKQRLIRHVPWSIAKEKPIVKVQWLVDSAREGKSLPYEPYEAIPLLRNESSSPQVMTPTASQGASLSPPAPSGLGLSPPPRPTLRNANPRLEYTSNYSCCRLSPLKCANEELVQQFSVIRRMRELESGQGMHALAYERTIAVLKAFPEVITTKNLDKVKALPYVGQKSMTKIKEFLKTGYISESQAISEDPRYRTLVLFNKIYSVGPSSARKYYDSLGLRTLNDVAIYHGANFEDERTRLHESFDPESSRRPSGGSEPPSLEIGRAIALVPELEEKVPREEVEAIRDVVMAELKSIQPDCKSTIVGGYRRGKDMSNDVDIIISHKGKGTVTGLCKKLVKKLYEKGYVKNVMHLSSFRAPHALRTTNRDTLEKALTVFILPEKSYHRRVDLIFAEPEVYWTAVVGWTGSKMFERDLRKWAKDCKGLKFDSSGITRRHDSKFIPAWSEEEVFDILGLTYVPPELRNADA